MANIVKTSVNLRKEWINDSFRLTLRFGIDLLMTLFPFLPAKILCSIFLFFTYASRSSFLNRKPTTLFQGCAIEEMWFILIESTHLVYNIAEIMRIDYRGFSPLGNGKCHCCLRLLLFFFRSFRSYTLQFQKKTISKPRR